MDKRETTQHHTLGRKGLFEFHRAPSPLQVQAPIADQDRSQRPVVLHLHLPFFDKAPSHSHSDCDCVWAKPIPLQLS
jgi:hypothetical protein